MEIKGVDFILYNVSDYKRAIDFYQNVLGLQLVEDYKGRWGEFNIGAMTLVICSNDSMKKGGATIALAVDDVKKSVEYLKTKNIKISEEPRETKVCFMAKILDPDGNEIILHQRKDGTAG